MRLSNIVLAFIFGSVIWGCNSSNSQEKDSRRDTANASGLTPESVDQSKQAPALDTVEYNRKIQEMANGDTSGGWPVKGPYPLPGAIFPFNRVVAYYGNLFSTRMGALGEYPKEQMLKMLMDEKKKWEKADSSLPVIPALHYIAVTAQGAPGRDGKYRLRMPFHQIDTIINWAKEIDALVFVDVQVGHANLATEVLEFKEYFKLPNFHLGIDPEFSMKGGQRPGSVIGSFNANDINSVIDILAQVVKENNLPPKILVVHRFTHDMVMNYKNIKLVPEVQVVIDMDGWGNKALKANTWKRWVYEQPVQFAGFKIFYKNDLKQGGGLYTPEELSKFIPKPIYIQYQ